MYFHTWPDSDHRRDVRGRHWQDNVVLERLHKSYSQRSYFSGSSWRSCSSQAAARIPGPQTPRLETIILPSLYPSPLASSYNHIASNHRPLSPLDAAQRHLLHRPVRSPATVHVVRVHARRALRSDLPEAAPVAAIKVHVLEVEGMDVARKVSAKRQSVADGPFGSSIGRSGEQGAGTCLGGHTRGP
jgi:hypothetical protein